MKKICSKCKLEKPISEFYKQKGGKFGVLSSCISCVSKYNKKYRQENREKCRKYDKKWREENPEYRKNYYKKNRVVALEQRKKYYQEHYKEHYEYCKKYRQENPNYYKKLNKKRYSSDPLYKLKVNLRNRIYKSLKGYSKSKKTEEIIGCSFERLKEWIESKFEEGMAWNNHGTVWEIDHIVPVSLGTCKEEVCKLNNYENLQPMWWRENRKKYNHVEKI